jgi:hypothetical protein
MVKGGRCYAYADDRLLDAQVVTGALPSHPERWAFYCVWVCNLVDKYLSVGIYRVVYNSLTQFTKSVHLNGGKDFKCDRRVERETPHFLYMPRAPGFVGDRQVRRLSENAGDGR